MNKDFKCKKCGHEWDWRKQNEIYLCPQCGKAQTKKELTEYKKLREGY